jgi:hypothetical protein
MIGNLKSILRSDFFVLRGMQRFRPSGAPYWQVILSLSAFCGRPATRGLTDNGAPIGHQFLVSVWSQSLENAIPPDMIV